MTKEVAICYGTSGSGKTTTAKASNGYSLFSFDDNYWNKDFDTFKRNLMFFIQEHNKVIIDGWMGRDELTNLIKELEQEYNLKYCICVVVRDVQDISRSWKEKSGDVIPPSLEYNMICKAIEHVKNIHNGKGAILQLADGVYYTHNLNISQHSLDKLLYSKVDFDEADNYIKSIGKIYHNIYIGNKQYGGHKDCEQTWTQIASCIDFKDKTVLDLGCYYGFFSFRAEEYGAKKVVGYDYGNLPEVTNKLAQLKNSKATFESVDLDKMDTQETPDIIFLLNVLHHNSAPLHVLKEMFSKAQETIVMECELPHDERLHNQRVIELSEFKARSQKGKGMLQRLSPVIFDEFAAEYKFVNKKIVDSVRPNRAIFIYSK